MRGETKKRLEELHALSAVEQDSEKLRELAAAIIQLLKEDEEADSGEKPPPYD